jgi:hypothetical protein
MGKENYEMLYIYFNDSFSSQYFVNSGGTLVSMVKFDTLLWEVVGILFNI